MPQVCITKLTYLLCVVFVERRPAVKLFAFLPKNLASGDSLFVKFVLKSGTPHSTFESSIPAR